MTDTDKLTLLRAGTLPTNAAEWVEGIIRERDELRLELIAAHGQAGDNLTRALDAEEAKREAYLAGVNSGWNAAIDAAAKAAENRWRSWGSLRPHNRVECDVTACEDIADRIRALKASQ